jgi:hypothetical protein
VAREFFPYPAADNVQMSIKFAGAKPKVAGNVLDLSELDKSSPPFQVHVTAKVDQRSVKSVVDPSERAKPPLQLVVRLLAVDSRRRSSLPMKKVGNKYNATLTIDPKEWFGDVVIEVAALRSAPLAKTGVPYASDKGAIVLTTSQQQTVRLDAVPERESSGKGLPNRWEDFTQPNSIGHSHQDQLFVIDTQTNPPSIVLNSGLAAEVRQVLDSKGTHGLEARMRDVALAAIAVTCTSSLLAEALITAASEKTPTLDILESWQQSLVQLAAPIMYPQSAPATAVDDLLNDLDEPELLWDTIRRKVPTAAQAITRTARSVKDAAAEVFHGQ